MRRILFAAVAAACLAIPALAAGEDHARAVDHITCGDGTTLTPPFASPVCAGHGDIASLTCVSGAVLTPPLDGKRCPSDQEQSSSNSDDGNDGNGQTDTPQREAHPHFKAAFLNRVWRITGEANGFDAGVLDFTAGDFVHLPRRFASQDDAVVGFDTRVLVGTTTRVYDADHHRLAGGDVAAALDDAADVTVTAKILPPAKWQQDGDGATVPTLRAKRISIVD
jgi:hypothetical protein